MYHASRMKKKEIVSMEPKEFIRIDVAEKNTSGIEYHFTNGSYFVFPAGFSVQMIKAW